MKDLFTLHVLKEMLSSRLKSMIGTLRSCQKVCEALVFLLDNIYIRFTTKLFRQIVGIPMSTYCAPLVADLFLFCYERDFMMSLSADKHAEIIEVFSSTNHQYTNQYGRYLPSWSQTIYSCCNDAIDISCIFFFGV